jgi:hypothetical protein
MRLSEAARGRKALGCRATGRRYAARPGTHVARPVALPERAGHGVKTHCAIASSFNANVPMGVGVASGKNLTPGICFGSCVIWCKRTLDLKPSEPSSADTVFAG